MDLTIPIENQQIEHDKACKTSWDVCSCVVAILIRGKAAIQTGTAKKAVVTAVIGNSHERIDRIQAHYKSCDNKPYSDCDCEAAKVLQAEHEVWKEENGLNEKPVTQIPEQREVPEDLVRKRRIYLENAGISFIRKRLLDLSPQAQFDRIHELDRATKDEAYLSIRKAKDGVKASIESLRAILQGMDREEREIRERENNIERMLQERKDRAYVAKTVTRVGDAIKSKKGAPKDPKAAVAGLGIDVSKLLSGFNAELALQRIKEKNSEEKK